MFRKTPPQRPLFAVEAQLEATKRARLERTWAHQYRRHALSLIDEAQFAPYFDPANGRPNKSIRMVVSVLVLKEMFDLTDVEALEQLEWNTAWHYALDLTPEEAHLCQKTLHNHRQFLLADDRGAGLFEATTARLIQAAGLRTGRQRQDSTHILSNIKVLTRLGLFCETLTHFLEVLRDEHPRLCEKVDAELRDRYLDREGYFADARRSEAPRRLAQAALDVYRLVQQFAAHKAVTRLEAYGLLSRLYTEQCVPPTSEAPVYIELAEQVRSDALQSPADPDATYGHKGKGYEVQLMETCEPENPFQAVTAVSVNGAHESDQHQVAEALAQSEVTCGAAPERLHADAGYGRGENLVGAKEQYRTELLAPIGSKASTQHLPVCEFTFAAPGRTVLACPAGHAPERQQPTKAGKTTLAWFAEATCRRCPHRAQCPVEKRRGGRVLKFNAAAVAVARRRIEQETPAFKEQHQIRSGIEATNSELKRRHGLGKLHVRRRVRVELAVRLKVLALNIKRYVMHLTEACAGAPAVCPICAA